MKRRSLVSMLAAAPLVPTAAALAQTTPAAAWSPDRPIRFVVGFAPGGSTDTAGRVIAEAITGPLGQPIVVENRTGAAGNIGSEFVARSAPDGYTYIVASIGTHATNQFLYADLPFHVVRDFAPCRLPFSADASLWCIHPFHSRTSPT